MEEHNQKNNPIDEWLQVQNRTLEDKQVIYDFANFCEKTPKQIIEEFSDSSRKQFSKYYGKQLLMYTAHLQKEKMPSNNVREQVNTIRSFFRYNRLPLKFGVSAHIQFFFK